MKIYTKNSSSARDISRLSGKVAEKEVLFKSKTNFLITKIDFSTITIELEETKDKPQVILNDCYHLNEK